MNNPRRSNLLRLLMIGILLLICIGLEYSFHRVLGIHVVYTHLFYIPIVVAALWWGLKGGLSVSLFLALMYTIMHTISCIHGISTSALTRILALVSIGFVVGIVSDKHKKAKEALKESGKKFKIITENSADAIFITDSNGKYIYTNKAVTELLGFTKEEMKGKTIIDLAPQNKINDYFEIFKNIKTEGKILTGIELLKNDGTYISTDLNAVILPDGNVYGSCRDITKRKQAEQKLKEAMEIKSQFISMASHELRTPLTAIKEGIAIVMDGSTGKINDEQEDFLGMAKRNVDRLARLINDVLDFQKLEAGGIEFNIQEKDINEVVKEVYETMVPLTKEKGLNFVVKLDENLPKARFDNDKIIQVLTNIVNNAIKFTEKGTITVTTSKQDNVVCVAVQDTGPGVKKEDIPKLFHKFEQLAKKDDRKIGGTGLGLAISKEIVEKHNGEIWAESKHGKGITFYFTLPVMENGK